MSATGRAIGWQSAWAAALYGPDGFYRGAEGPAGHFRTAVHAAAPTVAAALAALARQAGCTGVIDLGAGRGELSSTLSRIAPDLAVHAVDVVPRPADLPTRVGWTRADPADGDPLPAWPDRLLDGVLVVAWELLDVVPCPVLEVDQNGARRVVLVDPATGAESLGPAADDDPQAAAWCRRWWPVDGAMLDGAEVDGAEAGVRVEVGLPRDQLWAAIAGRLRSGLMLAVDYGHLAGQRPPLGSLAGFRRGRQVPPVPDGRCDLTAEVALDALAEAARAAGAGPGRLLDQRSALTWLVGSANCPAELLDPGGLGGFSWLLQPVGMPAPHLAGAGAPLVAPEG